MTLLHGVAVILVYAVIALLASAAGSQRATRQGNVTVFPVLKLYRGLVWSGGVLSAIVGVQEFISAGVTLTAIFFLSISLATIMLPLQSVVISTEGVGSLPVLFTKGVVIPWNSVQRVEHSTRGNRITVVGEKGKVIHTRYNADPELFEEMLEQHVERRCWSLPQD